MQPNRENVISDGVLSEADVDAAADNLNYSGIGI